MRTTVNIDDKVLAKVKDYGKKRGVSLGRAMSDLLYEGLEARPKFKKRNGFTILEIAPGSPPITTEMVKKIQEDYEMEDALRALYPRR
jgi:hypothetical protein